MVYRYVSLFFVLAAGTLVAEEFTPQITIKNHTHTFLTLQTGKVTFHLPKNGEKIFYRRLTHLNLYPSSDITAKFGPWCLIDSESTSDENCWMDKPHHHNRLLGVPCTSPLITRSIIDRATIEHNDIVVTIKKGESQEFVGSVELTTRRGYLSGIWHSTTSFIGSFFGRP